MRSNMTYEIKRVMTGKMGNNFRPYYEIYVDGNLVGGAARKWVATEIAKAIEAGHMKATGDTTLGWLHYLGANPEVYRVLKPRLEKLPENYDLW